MAIDAISFWISADVSKRIFHLEISHVCRWRSGEESSSKLRRKFYLSYSTNAEIFDTSAIAFLSHRQDPRKRVTKWNERRTSKVFVRANNRFKPTEKKIGLHPPLRSKYIRLFNLTRVGSQLVKGAYYCLTFLKEKHVSGRARTPRISSMEMPFLLLASIIRWMGNIYLIIGQLTPSLWSENKKPLRQGLLKIFSIENDMYRL